MKSKITRKLAGAAKNQVVAVRQSYNNAKKSRSYEDIATFLLDFAAITLTYWMLGTVIAILLYMAGVNLGEYMFKLYCNLSIAIPMGAMLGVSVRVASNVANRYIAVFGALSTLLGFAILSINIWRGFDVDPNWWFKLFLISMAGTAIFTLSNILLLVEFWKKIASFAKPIIKTSAVVAFLIASYTFIIGDTEWSRQNDPFMFLLVRGFGIALTILLWAGFIGLSSLLIDTEESIKIKWRAVTAASLTLIITIASILSILTLTLEWYTWMKIIFTAELVGSFVTILIGSSGSLIAYQHIKSSKRLMRITSIIAFVTTLICSLTTLEQIWNWKISSLVVGSNHYTSLLFHSWLFASMSIFLLVVGFIPKSLGRAQHILKRVLWGSSFAFIVLLEGLVEFKIFKASNFTVGATAICMVLMISAAGGMFLIYRREKLKNKGA